MKICCLSQEFGNRWSGIGTYSEELIRGLCEKGHEVTIICPEPGELQENVGKNIRLVPVRMSRWDISHDHWLSLSFNLARVLHKISPGERFDLIHILDVKNTLFVRKFGVPVIGTVHDYYFSSATWKIFYYRKYYKDWFKRMLYYNLVKILEGYAIRKLDFAITNTRFVEGMVQRVYHVRPGKTRTVYIGLQCSPRPDHQKQKANPNIILTIGGNYLRMGVPALVKAVGMMRDQFPDLRVKVVGRDISHRRQMEKLCAAYRVRSFFEFMGWRKHEELPALYAEADVVVKPSLMEGFGLIFLEAMRAGVPVIGGNVGGTPELIQDGYNGFLVNPNDVTSLHQKLSALLCDKHLYHQVRMNGFKTAQRFTRNRMVEDTIRCYQDVREGKIPR